MKSKLNKKIAQPCKFYCHETQVVLPERADLMRAWCFHSRTLNSDLIRPFVFVYE